MEDTFRKESAMNIGFPILDTKTEAVMRFFVFATASRPALGPTQPPIQLVGGGISPGGKTTQIKNAWNYTSGAG
jgi:hypothetical protein